MADCPLLCAVSHVRAVSACNRGSWGLWSLLLAKIKILLLPSYLKHAWHNMHREKTSHHVHAELMHTPQWARNQPQQKFTPAASLGKLA